MIRICTRTVCLPLVSIVLSGCVAFPSAPKKQSTATSYQPQVERPPLKVFIRIPAQPHRFSTWQKMNPIWWFGNADDTVPPKGYRTGKFARTLTWYLRNPFHNFNYYVIGIADKPFARSGPYPTRIQNPNGGWNWAVCRYKWLQLPFVDYQKGRFEFYFGWRTGGNFGIKINFKQAKKKEPKPPRSAVQTTKPN